MAGFDYFYVVIGLVVASVAATANTYSFVREGGTYVDYNACLLAGMFTGFLAGILWPLALFLYAFSLVGLLVAKYQEHEG